MVRTASPEDAPAMAAILNAIVALGGTTAHQHPKPVETVHRDYIDGPEVIASVVAEDGGGVIVGWQSVGLYLGEADIGTFVRPGVQARGAGTAMFALTCGMVRDAGHRSILAVIRRDNAPGLAYYARLGFRDIGGDPDFALEDGTIVGRVRRRYDLA